MHGFHLTAIIWKWCVMACSPKYLRAIYGIIFPVAVVPILHQRAVFVCTSGEQHSSASHDMRSTTNSSHHVISINNSGSNWVLCPDTRRFECVFGFWPMCRYASPRPSLACIQYMYSQCGGKLLHRWSACYSEARNERLCTRWPKCDTFPMYTPI